jgi:hypothetical protein
LIPQWVHPAIHLFQWIVGVFFVAAFSTYSFFLENFFNLDLFFSHGWCGASHNVVGRHCRFLVTKHSLGHIWFCQFFQALHTKVGTRQLVYASICTRKSLSVKKIQFMWGSSIRTWFIMFLSLTGVGHLSYGCGNSFSYILM